MKEIEGSQEFFECELCLLALGFEGVESDLVEALEVDVEKRLKRVVTKSGVNGRTGYSTSVEGVFAAGDCRRGQSLIVCKSTCVFIFFNGKRY